MQAVTLEMYNDNDELEAVEVATIVAQYEVTTATIEEVKEVTPMKSYPTPDRLRALAAAIHGAFPTAENCSIYNYVAASHRSPSGFVIRFRFPDAYWKYAKHLAHAAKVQSTMRRIRIEKYPGQILEFSFPVEAESARPEWMKLFTPCDAELYRED